MLFWLSVICLIIGIAVMIFGENGHRIVKEEKHENLHRFLYRNDGYIIGVGFGIIFIFVIAVVVMICVIISNYAGINAKISQQQERYRALEFKVDSQSYRDEFGLLNKEVIDEIQQWNEDVAYIKHIQRDFWLGIFWPNVYDEFQTIDYERY